MIGGKTIERTWSSDGLVCAIALVSLGWGPPHRCGYVRLPEGHPFTELDDDPSGGLRDVVPSVRTPTVRVANYALSQKPAL